jgi:hypothetical protein
MVSVRSIISQIVSDIFFFFKPGMLWRFKDLKNTDYKVVFVCDIDETWDWVNVWVQRYNDIHSDVSLFTLIPTDVNISSVPHDNIYNFPTIIGSHIMGIPSRLTFNITDVMIGFLTLCKERENSKNPYCFKDNHHITSWNHPINEHMMGWGKSTTGYGFDELFMKHVIYYAVYPHIKFIG